MTMYFNACPKCKGTVVQRKDDFGVYLQCISCSRIVDLKVVAAKPEVKAPQKIAA
jgi:ssDNA-binding Zn-finger/Zn-ribbon topoisomerase 1